MEPGAASHLVALGAADQASAAPDSHAPLSVHFGALKSAPWVGSLPGICRQICGSLPADVVAICRQIAPDLTSPVSRAAILNQLK
jgi:hypothetical protein